MVLMSHSIEFSWLFNSFCSFCTKGRFLYKLFSSTQLEECLVIGCRYVGMAEKFVELHIHYKIRCMQVEKRSFDKY